MLKLKNIIDYFKECENQDDTLDQNIISLKEVLDYMNQIICDAPSRPIIEKIKKGILNKEVSNDEFDIILITRLENIKNRYQIFPRKLNVNRYNYARMIWQPRNEDEINDFEQLLLNEMIYHVCPETEEMTSIDWRLGIKISYNPYWGKGEIVFKNNMYSGDFRVRGGIATYVPPTPPDESIKYFEKNFNEIINGIYVNIDDCPSILRYGLHEYRQEKINEKINESGRQKKLK